MITRSPPTWFRILQIGIGAVSVILSMLAIAYPGLAVFSIIVLISIVLLIIGIERVIIGMLSYSRPYPDEQQSVSASFFSSFFIGRRSSPFTNIGLGIIAIALAIVALAFPLIATGVLIALVSFGLILTGVARIISSINKVLLLNVNLSKSQGKKRILWYNVLTIGIGVLSIILAVIIIMSSALGIFFLALVLSVALLINGVEMIILGITGRRLAFEGLK
jgi:uncharacterized membrane protein HdeD (DUF308 family)